MLNAIITADDDANVILSVLSPEIGRELPRTDTNITRDNDTVIINVEAKDVSAMRAAMNSYLGWIRITENIKEMT